MSRQEFDNAVARQRSAEANVQAARAAADKATIELGFTEIRSPIAGIVGIALAQLGDFVGPSDPNPLTSVSQLDPIRVSFPLSEQEYLHFAPRFQKALVDRGFRPKALQLILADGSVYPYFGTAFPAGREIDPRTGTITVKGVFENPDRVLRPGLYARVRVETDLERGAVVVPQRALQDLQGSAQLAVVKADDTVDLRAVKKGAAWGTLQVVKSGVAPGERVIVEGFQKVRPGTKVVPKPAPPELAGAPPTSGPPASTLAPAPTPTPEPSVSPAPAPTARARPRGPLAMAAFFVRRPIVAIVIAILTVLLGIVSIVQLPIAQYPSIAPPAIQLSSTYVGADALTAEQAVATPIEQQMSGVDGSIYMYSVNTNAGTATLYVNFEVGTDPNIDQVLAQMRYSQAEAQLPEDVRNLGVTIRKSTTSPLLLISLCLAGRHLRRALPRELRLHQRLRPDVAREGHRAGVGLRRRPVRDAALGAPGRAGTARHHGARDRRRDPQPEHREPGRAGRLRAGAAGPGVHLHRPRAGPARRRGAVRRHRRARFARRLG